MVLESYLALGRTVELRAEERAAALAPGRAWLELARLVAIVVVEQLPVFVVLLLGLVVWLVGVIGPQREGVAARPGAHLVRHSLYALTLELAVLCVVASRRGRIRRTGRGTKRAHKQSGRFQGQWGLARH